MKEKIEKLIQYFESQQNVVMAFYQVLTKGLPLSIKDEKLYLDLLCKLTYEAFDWVDFVTDYYEISKRAKSISPLEKVKEILNKA